MKKGKEFKALKELHYEVKVGNRIVADKTIKGILTREIMNRDLIKKEK